MKKRTERKKERKTIDYSKNTSPLSRMEFSLLKYG